MKTILPTIVMLVTSLVFAASSAQASVLFFEIGQPNSSGGVETGGPLGPYATAGFDTYNDLGRGTGGTTLTDVITADGTVLTGTDIVLQLGKDGAWGSDDTTRDSDPRSGVMDEGIFETYARADGIGKQAGWRLRGFAPGAYEMNFIWNTRNVLNSSSVGFHVGLGGEAGDPGVDDFNTSALTFYAYDQFDLDATSWTEGQVSGNNYVKQAFTIVSADQYVEFIFDSVGSGQLGNLGGPSAVQLIPVVIPEPASLAASLVGLALLAGRRRHR